MIGAVLDTRLWKDGASERRRKETCDMISANISNQVRREVYRRDGYRCALCDSTKYLQVHHYIPRGSGGSDKIENLICLCADCHALAHGLKLTDWTVTREDVEFAMCEYLADYYAPDWDPYRRGHHPLEREP